MTPWPKGRTHPRRGHGSVLHWRPTSQAGQLHSSSLLHLLMTLTAPSDAAPLHLERNWRAAFPRPHSRGCTHTCPQKEYDTFEYTIKASLKKSEDGGRNSSAWTLRFGLVWLKHHSLSTDMSEAPQNVLGTSPNLTLTRAPWGINSVNPSIRTRKPSLFRNIHKINSCQKQGWNWNLHLPGSKARVSVGDTQLPSPTQAFQHPLLTTAPSQQHSLFKACESVDMSHPFLPLLNFKQKTKNNLVGFWFLSYHQNQVKGTGYLKGKKKIWSESQA